MINLFELDDYLLTAIILLFLLINFNLEIGTIYGFMLLIDWFSYNLALRTNAFSVLPIERDKNNRLMNLVYAMGAYVVFIFIVNFITIRMGMAQSTSALENVSALISGTFSASPILAGNKFLRLVVWGVLIALIESRAFFRTWLQWGLNAVGMKMPQKALSFPAFIIAAFFGAVFAIFHLVAKGITNNSSLFVTFCFGFASVLLIIHFKEAIQAIFLHVITNTIATMQQLKIGFFSEGTVGINSQGIIVLGGIILITWFVLFQNIPLVGIKAIG